MDPNADPSVIKFNLKDLDDGSYLVTYKVDDPCEVIIDIQFLDQNEELVPIRGSPYTASFVAEGDAKETNTMQGQAIKEYIRSTLTNIKTFINQAKEDTDYKSKNLEDVKEVITIMASIANI